MHTHPFLAKIRQVLIDYPVYVAWVVSKNKRLFSILAGIVLMILVLLVKLWYTKSQIRNKTHVTVSITDLFTTVHPIVLSDRVLDNMFKRLVYSPLLYVESDGSLTPVLLESFSIGKENKIYTLRLKEGIYWSDKTLLTTQDVIFTYNFIKKNFPDTQIAKALEGATMTRFGDYILEIRLKNPYVGFLRLLDFSIAAEHRYKDLDIYALLEQAYTTNIVENGPYVLDYLSIDKFTLADAKNQKLLVTFNYQKSPKDVYIDMVANVADIGVFTVTESALIEKLRTHDDIRVVKYPITNNIKGLFINLKASGILAKDSQVRQALLHLLAPSIFVNAFDTTPAFSIYPEGSSYFLPSLKTRSIQRGQDLLGDKKIHFVLSYLDIPEEARVAQFIKDFLSKYGINVTLDPINVEDFDFKIFEQKDFEVLLYGIKAPTDPDQSVFWHSKGALNIIGLEDLDIDQLLEQGLVTYNMLDRQIVYNRLQDKLINQEAVFIPLYHPNLYVAYKEYVQNLGFSLESKPITTKADFVRVAFPGF